MSRKKNDPGVKFIVVTGGVISGLGKGIAAASIGNLISSKLRIVPIKCDGYLNTDPGTMNPVEHGEVFVLDDGGEVDMDFGHYERFLGINTKFGWNLTMGKIFKNILEKERRGDYLGSTVQFIPHVVDEIKQRFYDIAAKEKADIVIIEIGGTIGDLENQFYVEAARQLRSEIGEENISYIHLTYVPIPSGVNEQKSKPTQQSVKLLMEKGIEPDVIIGRCSEFISDKVKQKIASFANLEKEAVISGVDVETVYDIPVIFEEEGISEIIHKKLNIYSPPALRKWKVLVENIKRNNITPRKTVTVAIGGKYTALEDSYASIIEALVHCGAHLDVKIAVKWIETSAIETGEKVVEEELDGVDAVIIPGGFGTRGIEGKIEVIKYIRENNIPFLGICLGMQLAVVEFARNVCGIKGANTAEVKNDGLKVKAPVIDILPEQKKVKEKGATMRLGGQDVQIQKGTKAFD
ncbi:MAG: glutamine hydrolyzing CTP synthase, partial [Fibrobacterota bacterium]